MKRDRAGGSGHLLRLPSQRWRGCHRGHGGRLLLFGMQRLLLRLLLQQLCLLRLLHTPQPLLLRL